MLSDVPYDPVADFTPIANVSVAQRLLVANKDMPFKTFEEFVAYGKAHPGEMNYGSVGVGSTGHVATVDLLRAVGVEAMHIPYKGASDVVQAVLTGDIQFMLDAAAAAQVRQDTVTPLAVGGDTPKAEFPDIPTYADLGVDALSGTGWQMVMGPAGMPQEVVDQLIGALDEALKSPELLEKMDKLGLTARFIPGEELASALADESTKMDKILSDMGMKKK